MWHLMRAFVSFLQGILESELQCSVNVMTRYAVQAYASSVGLRCISLHPSCTFQNLKKVEMSDTKPKAAVLGFSGAV